MADRLTRSTRSALMSRVKSQHTAPEMLVRKAAYALGYRFRLHCQELPGCPDLVFRRYQAVVFVHGCFWHGHRSCRRSARPTSNVSFWNQKLDANEKRDRRNVRKLRALGWRVLTIWECQTHDLDLIRRRLSEFFGKLSPVKGGLCGEE